MTDETDCVEGFEELFRGSVRTTRGNGACLGEMARVGLTVPHGFVVTTSEFLRALDASGVRTELRRVFAETSPDDVEQLAMASERLRAAVAKSGMPRCSTLSCA